jgi:sugar fermentation stimulation protein A
VVLFLAGRSDCHRFSLASDLDSAFAAALARAEAAGVEVLAYDCRVDPGEVSLRGPLARAAL